MKTFIAFALVFGLIQPSVGQTYVFKVLASKGDNKYKSISEPDWKEVKTGTDLNSGDVLKILEEAYLGLVHSSGKTQELTSAGTFKIDELASMMGSRKSGLASRYSEFVLNKLTQAQVNDPLAFTGAVTRSANESEITILSPVSSEVYTSQPVLFWNGHDEAGYVVQVKNMFDEDLFTEQATDNLYQLNLNRKELEDQKVFFLMVSSKSNPDTKSNPIGLERLSGGKAIQIEQELAELDQEVQRNTSLGHLIIGGYFEDQNLLIDALIHYQKAAQLSPGVAEFELMYQDFLVRYNLH